MHSIFCPEDRNHHDHAVRRATFAAILVVFSSIAGCSSGGSSNGGGTGGVKGSGGTSASGGAMDPEA